jgi:hypothetical protein
MPHSPPDPSRRRFIRLGIAGATAVPLAGTLLSRTAWPTLADNATEKVDETEPLAIQLGYHIKATDVEQTRFPQFTDQQFCGNCQLYAGTSGESWGPCTLFGGRLVAAEGWCSAWTAQDI